MVERGRWVALLLGDPTHPTMQADRGEKGVLALLSVDILGRAGDVDQAFATEGG